MTNESIQAAGSPTLGAGAADEKPHAVQHVVSADVEPAMKPVNVADNAFIPVGGLTMSEEEKKLVSLPRAPHVFILTPSRVFYLPMYHHAPLLDIIC